MYILYNFSISKMVVRRKHENYENYENSYVTCLVFHEFIYE
jgi:hypothetical protein